MSTPNEKLAASLAKLNELQSGGRCVFRSAELSRVHRERLVRNGFMLEIMKGWLVSAKPGTTPGDTTPWYSAFWEFCARYCTHRFGDAWYLSPEQSLLLHVRDGAVPAQIVVCSPKGTNNAIDLPFHTSIYDLNVRQMPPSTDLTFWNGVRIFEVATALIRVPESFFQFKPVEAAVALASVADGADMLRRLLDGGHSAVAGRLAGAFRHVNCDDIADDIVATMKAADYDVREVNPFKPEHTVAILPARTPPIVGRLTAFWHAMRGDVIAAFPSASRVPLDQNAYLREIDEIYQNDAYHSLSIEGYRVTQGLIERVRAGDWNPDTLDADRKSTDALAARGYWQAFQQVKNAVAAIMGSSNAGEVVRKGHREWYRALFQPCVAAGLISASALAGYRREPVFIRGSRHVPPRSEVVAEAMQVLFDLLEKENEASVRAVLGHWFVGYIHPYSDGNGRMARFLMNTMLASGGFSWMVIRVEDRGAYMEALEAASVGQDIRPFARFLGQRTNPFAERQ
jgi:fido (protein-threonine AMPylation protein)